MRPGGRGQGGAVDRQARRRPPSSGALAAALTVALLVAGLGTPRSYGTSIAGYTAELSAKTLTISHPGAEDGSLSVSLSNGNYSFTDDRGGAFAASGGSITGAGTSRISSPKAAVDRIVVHLGGGSDQLRVGQTDGPIASLSADTANRGEGHSATVAGAVTVDGDLSLIGFHHLAFGGPLNVLGASTFVTDSPFTYAINLTSAGTITATSTETSTETTTPLPPPDDDITVNSGITVTSTGGDVVFNSADGISLNSGSAVTAPSGHVALNTSVGDVDNDGGATIRGTVDSSSTPSLTGAASDETFTIDYTNGATLPHGLAVNGGTGVNTLTVSDAGEPSGNHTYNVDPSQIVRDSAAPITYSNIQHLNVTGGDGSSGDTFNVTPSANTDFILNGGLPTTSPGDQLTVNTTGTTSPTLTTGAAGSGQYTFANRQPVTYHQMETVTPQPPTITKSFGAASIPLNGTTTLTFTVAKPSTSTSLTGVGFSDGLPSGLVVATPNGLSNNCGGTATATAASSTITLSGATLASGSCTLSVNVTATTSGFKNNSVTVASTQVGPSNTSNASIVVVDPPTINKSFGAASIPLHGATTLTFTLNNPNASTPLTGVAFTDNLPAGLVVATPNGLSNNCGGTATATAASSTITLSGAAIPASTSCALVVNVTSTTSAVKNNTTGAITDNEGGTGATSNTATLTVVAPPTTPAASAVQVAPNFTG